MGWGCLSCDNTKDVLVPFSSFCHSYCSLSHLIYNFWGRSLAKNKLFSLNKTVFQGLEKLKKL